MTEPSAGDTVTDPTYHLEIYPQDKTKPRLPLQPAEWIFKCSRPGCTWITGYRYKEYAEDARNKHHTNATCPWGKPARQGSPSMTTILTSMWTRLDRAISDFKKVEHASNAASGGNIKAQCEYEQARGRAYGIAECLYEACIPIYAGRNAVLAHGMKRYEAAQAGENMPPTPGIEGYNPLGTITPNGMERAPKAPLVNMDGTPVTSYVHVNTEQAPAPGKSSRNRYKVGGRSSAVAGIDKRKQDIILFALNSGQTPEDVAKMCLVSVETVRQVQALTNS